MVEIILNPQPCLHSFHECLELRILSLPQIQICIMVQLGMRTVLCGVCWFCLLLTCSEFFVCTVGPPHKCQ